MPDVLLTIGTASMSLGASTTVIGKVYVTDGTEDASVNASNQLEVAEANSADIKASVQVMDDWDSSDKCKVTLTDGTNTMPTMDAAARKGFVAVTDGTHTADINASSQLSVSVDNNPTLSSLPAGTNNIGDVDIASSIPAGTNNIGDVDIASPIPAGTNNIGDVDIASALPAGTNIIGAAKRDIVNYTKVCKYVALANTNETTIWDPTAGKKFVITDIFVSATAAGTCTLKDGTTGTTFLIASLAANGGFVSNLQTPIQSATADNNLTGTASAATQYITVCGYEV